MTKKILWIRKLSCKHERPTNIAYLTGNYEKPNVGDTCYCQTCLKDVKVIGVKEHKKC